MGGQAPVVLAVVDRRVVRQPQGARRVVEVGLEVVVGQVERGRQHRHEPPGQGGQLVHVALGHVLEARQVGPPVGQPVAAPVDEEGGVQVRGADLAGDLRGVRRPPRRTPGSRRAPGPSWRWRTPLPAGRAGGRRRRRPGRPGPRGRRGRPRRRSRRSVSAARSWRPRAGTASGSPAVRPARSRTGMRSVSATTVMGPRLRPRRRSAQNLVDQEGDVVVLGSAEQVAHHVLVVLTQASASGPAGGRPPPTGPPPGRSARRPTGRPAGGRSGSGGAAGGRGPRCRPGARPGRRRCPAAWQRSAQAHLSWSAVQAPTSASRASSLALRAAWSANRGSPASSGRPIRVQRAANCWSPLTARATHSSSLCSEAAAR